MRTTKLTRTWIAVAAFLFIAAVCFGLYRGGALPGTHTHDMHGTGPAAHDH